MPEYHQKMWQINQLFILLATMFMVLTVLKFASGIFVPFLISIAIAILLSPVFNYLERRHIPKALSLLFVTLLALSGFIILGGYISQEVTDFIRNLSSIQARVDSWLDQISGSAENYGLHLTHNDFEEVLNRSNLVLLVKNLVAQTKNQFSNIFLIFFTVAFMLMESTSLYNKLIKVMERRGSSVTEWMKIIDKIKDYFLIKVKTSLLTGVLALLILWFYNVHYAVLWASLVFFFNFIPVIGSILAAIPAIIMAGIDHGAMTAGWVALGYLSVNLLVGNILEPRIMGRGLGLSALTIFLSMTFWGWMFGPAGMILSVPLTMGMQFLFDQYEETQWIAFMLSDYEGEGRREEAPEEEASV
jgi:predicted PurR-regulated permease PerM